MVGQLARRAKMGDGSAPLDWAFAEGIAFGSLVLEGTRVRLSGQDSGRGTFSQRHAVLYDTQTGKAWAPLSGCVPSQSRLAFDVFDSSLSEEGVLGFEYGYTVVNQQRLVLWEAQFGDFGNGAQTDHRSVHRGFGRQVETDFETGDVAATRLRGQGPEHSSARRALPATLC